MFVVLNVLSSKNVKVVNGQCEPCCQKEEEGVRGVCVCGGGNAKSKTTQRGELAVEVEEGQRGRE